MKTKIFFVLIILVGFFACEKKKQPVLRPQGSFQVSEPDKSDREPNGGMLRFKLKDKAMHDKFFIAQFTPRGELFKNDNLQLFNYNIGSDKYPQFIINLNYKESELKKWEGQTFPLDFLAFTAAPNTTPLNSQGTLKITKVTNSAVEGTFSGKLSNPVSKKIVPIRGEFKAMIKLNI